MGKHVIAGDWIIANDADSNGFGFQTPSSVFHITFTCCLQPDTVAFSDSLMFMLNKFDLTAVGSRNMH